MADFLEERWPSMDLVVAMLARELPRVSGALPLEAKVLRPSFLSPLSAINRSKNSRYAYNAERALNRYLRYPLWLRRERNRFDVFHVVDHSYAHLVNYLPAERTIVTCHDLDVFRPLLESGGDSRSMILRAIAAHVRNGMRRASIVTCDTVATRDTLLKSGICSDAKSVVIHNGVDAEMLAAGVEAEKTAVEILGPPSADRIEILHVGLVNQRKRIDVALKVFAGVCRDFPDARLIRAGGPLDDELAELAASLAIRDRIITLPFVGRKVLGAIYRRAALLLVTSEAEGFGLPVIEGLACGTPVVASDIPALREVGGSAAEYCPVGDVERWRESATAILRERANAAAALEKRRADGIAWSAQFSWREYAGRMANLYHAVSEAAARAPLERLDPLSVIKEIE
ncbi:MAG TPA: glycosyltransferase [Candidatus Binataceae bacterium]|nr:glycosyltransferase [Candidatus Binataceae bacterium]